MPTKVYRYGVLQPEGEDLAMVWEQLRLAHLYRLALWRLASASRAQYRQRRREMFPELEAAEAELARLEELNALAEHKTERKKTLPLVKAQTRRVKELRAAVKGDEDFEQAVSEDREREGILKRALRGAFSKAGLYSGTYLIVEDADRRSRSGSRDPKEPKWNWTGSLGIQLQGGRTAPDIWSGKDPSIHVVPPQREGKGRRKGCQTIIRYRVRSKDHKPVCINLKAMVDRDLPSDAKVTWAKLVVSRCGASAIGRPRYAYSVQLTVESETFHRHEFGAGEVAVCFSNDEVTFAGDNEPTRVFATPGPFKKISDLQSIRDKNRNAAIGLIRSWAEDQDDVPTWILEGIEANSRKASCRRGVRFVRYFVADPDIEISAKLAKELKAWVYHENHLYQWQEDARAGWYRNRKDRYRVWAAELRRKYRYILLDNRRLDDPKLKTEERNARGLHELRLAIKHSFGPDYVIDVSGKDCSEMFDRWRESRAAAAE